jgi:hypothetical protein
MPIEPPPSRLPESGDADLGSAGRSAARKKPTDAVDLSGKPLLFSAPMKNALILVVGRRMGKAV